MKPTVRLDFNDEFYYICRDSGLTTVDDKLFCEPSLDPTFLNFDSYYLLENRNGKTGNEGVVIKNLWAIIL
jgi:hypothetical protein